jgi:hypothetical protein
MGATEAARPLAIPRGRPPIHSRLEILNGIFYVRRGTAGNCYGVTCRRGELSIFTSGRDSASGHADDSQQYSRMCRRRQDEASGAFIGEPAVQAIEQGAYEATMPRETSLGATGTCWFIGSVSCCWLCSRRPIGRTGRSPDGVNCAGEPISAAACVVGQRWCRCGRGSGAIVFADSANSAKSGWRWLQRPQRPRGLRPAVAVVVERTFAWLGRSRRLKADYGSLPHSTEALIHIAMIRLMLRTLGPDLTLTRLRCSDGSAGKRHHTAHAVLCVTSLVSRMVLTRPTF